jgi:hypothetical protein
MNWIFSKIFYLFKKKKSYMKDGKKDLVFYNSLI